MKKTVCAYCGVGCDFIVDNNKLKGLNGSCAKGQSQIKTINTNRLTKVKIRDNINSEFKESNYSEAIEFIASKIKATSPEKIGFYLSGQMLTEDYYVANKLAKGFVGTPNCDTNSRTCMASAVAGYKKSFGVDYVPVSMDDIDDCNLLIVIGANPAEAHVVLHNKIKKAQKKGLKVVVIDPRETLSAKSANLYIPIKVGTDIDFLNILAKRLIEDGKIDNDFIKNYSNGFETLKKEILALNEDELLKSCAINKEQFNEFYELFVNSKNIITAWTMGINQSIQGVDKNLAINNIHILTGQINKKGSGPFSLTGQPNAMGGREVGGLSTTLAVHLDYDKESIEKVSKFWNSTKVPKGIGLTAFEMIEQGNLDILIICHTDPVYHLPNRTLIEKCFKKIPLVVEINAYKDSESSKFAHIIIPATAFSQKIGTQTNLDRRVRIVEAFEDKQNILQDWEIFAKIGKALGYEKEFNFKDAKEVFKEYKEMTKLSHKGHLDIYKIELEKLKEQEFIWGENLFKDNIFLTKNGKANLFFVKNKNLSEQSSKEYPFILLTGRIRDQWHSGSKTKNVPTLLKHKKLEFVEINKDDARELGLKDGDIAEIGSKRGAIKAEVVISNINPKTLFIPISHREINYLTDDKLDPISKEPDYNHSAVYIKKVVSNH